MATGTLIVKINDRKVRRALREMDKRRSELGSVFSALKKPLRENLMAHAARNESPTGRKWQKRAASTMARVEKRASFHYVEQDRSATRRRERKTFKGPHQQVRFTKPLGKLPLSTKFVASRKRLSLKAMSPVRWSSVHNEGGTAGRGSRIPTRTFLDWDPVFLDHAAQMLLDWAYEPWQTGT